MDRQQTSFSSPVKASPAGRTHHRRQRSMAPLGGDQDLSMIGSDHTSSISQSSGARRPRQQRKPIPTSSNSVTDERSFSAARTPRAKPTMSTTLTPGPYHSDFEAVLTPSETDDSDQHINDASSSNLTPRPSRISPSKRTMDLATIVNKSERSHVTSECPPNCRCSDRDVELGHCSRASAKVTTSPSSDDENVPLMANGNTNVSFSWQQKRSSTSRSCSTRSPTHKRSGSGSGSVSSNRSSSLLKKSITHLIDSSSESEGPYQVHRHESQPASDNTMIARHHRRLGSQELQPPDAVSGDHRRRRREERDRLIRQRIEQKRLARLSGGTVTEEKSHPQTRIENEQRRSQTPILEEGHSFGSHQRERSFTEDLNRLHRISHPPSANSIAAFAAHVSPSKSEARTAALQQALAASQSNDRAAVDTSASNNVPTASSPRSASIGLDLPPLPAAAEDEHRSNTSLLQEGIRLLNKKQVEKKRESDRWERDEESEQEESKTGASSASLSAPEVASPASSRTLTPSPTGFSFTPQRMLKTASPPSSASSNGESPRRRAHRRNRVDSEVVSLNARVPPADALEARQRLAGALRSPLAEISRDADLPSSSGSSHSSPLLQAAVNADAETLIDKSSVQEDGQGPTTNSETPNVKSGGKARKTVRFSTDTEYLEPVDAAHAFSDDDDEDFLKSGHSDKEDSWEVADAEDSQTRPVEIDLDKALAEIQTEEQHSHELDKAKGTDVTVSAPEVESRTVANGTPIRLPPGAFISPIAAPKASSRMSNPAADLTPSFSQHVLRPSSQSESRSAAVVTPDRSVASTQADTPMMPGGLRFLKSVLPAKVSPAKTHTNGVVSPPLRGTRRLVLDRGQPPSYSAVISPHTSMTFSASIDSSLDVLGEEEEEGEEEDGANEVHQAEEAPGDLSTWQEGEESEHDSQLQFSPPRESTPPPLSPESMRARDDRDRSLTGGGSSGQGDSFAKREGSSFRRSSSLQNLEDIQPIASPPDTRPSTPDVKHSVMGEHPISGSDDRPSADDSLQITIGKFVQTLQARLQEREQSQSALVDAAKEVGILSKREPGGEVVADSSTSQDSDEQLVQSLKSRLDHFKDELAAFESKRVQYGQLDAEQLKKLSVTRELLEMHVGVLNSSGEAGSPNGEDFQQPSVARRLKTATSFALLQAVVVWLSLVAIRHGSQHLHRTVYYDPFYPHLYESSGTWNGVLHPTDTTHHNTLSASSYTPPLGVTRTMQSSSISAWMMELASATSPRTIAYQPSNWRITLHDWKGCLLFLKTIPFRAVNRILQAVVDPDFNRTGGFHRQLEEVS
ncbi:unnamed protein product [Sympodiomycopsis kandeliae]